MLLGMLKRCRIIGTSLNNAECPKWFKMVSDGEGLLTSPASVKAY